MAIHEQPGYPQSAGGGDSFPGTYNGSPVQDNGMPGDPYAGYVDYFGFNERDRWYFPDGKQWIEYKKLNEGDRAKYIKSTRSDVHLNQQTREARMSLDNSGERKALLLASITDWHVVRKDANGQFRPVPFPTNNSAGGELGKWIDLQDPALLSSLEKSIRKINPWLMNELTVEQIDKEISDLQELREIAAKREAEEKNF